MLEIVNWLMDVEQMAKDVYSRASDYFIEDKELNSFLTRIAEDEASHYHCMASAAEHLISLPSETPVIYVDEETKLKIEGSLTAISEKMDSNSLTKDFLLDTLANAEFSEWNHIFLYVVNTMKTSVKDFMHVATRIQQHKRAIEYFYENIAGGRNKIQKLKSVAPVWQENILVVDDSEVICRLIKAILDDEGNIDTAFNGKEGLDKLNNKYLSGRFELTSLPFSKMPEVYRSARVFTLVSEPYQSFEIVIVEAMATNVPVVTNDDPIRREIVNGAGILVDPTDINRYARAISEALTKSWDDIPRKRSKEFSWDEISTKYEELFSKL